MAMILSIHRVAYHAVAGIVAASLVRTGAKGLPGNYRPAFSNRALSARQPAFLRHQQEQDPTWPTMKAPRGPIVLGPRAGRLDIGSTAPTTGSATTGTSKGCPGGFGSL